MKTNEFGSAYAGRLSKACRQCWQGAELVLFITGRCNKKCWYCPISDKRAGKDVVYANERPIKHATDALQEAREMRAKGMGITGGEPLLVLNRVAQYIKLFKKTFGPEFYAHLYTWGDLVTPKALKTLRDAGLDEIRFHDPNNAVKALGSGMRVGIEVPVIPGEDSALRKAVGICADNGFFLNLNELEFSDSNYEGLLAQGFKHDPNTNAVKGSKGLAMKTLRYAAGKGVDTHFCSVRTKHRLQLANRLKRRAETIRKPWQSVDELGFLEYGVVDGANQSIAKEEKVFFNKKKKRIETTDSRARHIAKKHSLKAWHVVEYPSYDAWDFEKRSLT
ncbi:MAG: radical SAM protein [Candidatus Diapherotrites archaeon]|nr:radical SAM protein [Candidatus Diapherotrites archaeon]